MSDAKSVLDTPLDDTEEARLDAIADAEIDAGLDVPHEKVREWLAKLAGGREYRPPPPSMKVIWSPSALREVFRIYDDLTAFNPKAAT